MSPNIFKEIVEDLYRLYNPSKIKDVDNIISNYVGNEFDAIKTILLKYNFKGHPSYSENANRDDYVNYIIENYKNNIKVISKENLLKQTKEEELKKIQEQQNDKKVKFEELEKHKSEIERTSNKFLEKMEEQINSVESRMNDFESKYNHIQEIHEDISKFEGKIIDNEESEINNIKINIESLNFTDSDISLPSKEVLDSITKGSRLILKTSSGNVCGVEVKDITYDLVSYEGEIIKEIILEQI